MSDILFCRGAEIPLLPPLFFLPELLPLPFPLLDLWLFPFLDFAMARVVLPVSFRSVNQSYSARSLFRVGRRTRHGRRSIDRSVAVVNAGRWSFRSAWSSSGWLGVLCFVLPVLPVSQCRSLIGYRVGVDPLRGIESVSIDSARSSIRGSSSSFGASDGLFAYPKALDSLDSSTVLC